MDRSSKDKFSTKKSTRDINASKPSSETRRITPSAEQSLQSITENLIRIYEKLEKLERNETKTSGLTAFEERLQTLESKLDGVIEAKLDFSELESRLSKTESQRVDDDEVILRLNEIERNIKNIGSQNNDEVILRLNEIERDIRNIGSQNNDEVILRLNEIEEDIRNAGSQSNDEVILRLNGVEKSIENQKSNDNFVSRLESIENKIENIEAEVVGTGIENDRINNNIMISLEKVIVSNSSTRSSVERISEFVGNLSCKVDKVSDEICIISNEFGNLSDEVAEISFSTKATENNLNLIHTQFNNQITETKDELETHISSELGEFSNLIGQFAVESSSEALAMKDDIIRKCFSKFKKLSGEIKEIQKGQNSILGELSEVHQESSLQALKVESLKEQFDDLIQECSSQTQKLEDIKKELDEQDRRVLIEFDSMRGEFLERSVSQFDSIEESLSSAIKEVGKSIAKDVDQHFDEFQDEINTEIVSRLEYADRRMSVLTQENSSICKDVSSLKDGLDVIQNRVKCSLAEIISLQHGTKTLVKSMEGITTNVTSSLENNSKNSGGKDLELIKISENIEDIKGELVENGKLIKEIYEFENSLEYANEDETKEDIIGKFDNILDVQKEIQKHQENFECMVEKKFEDISKTQKTIQEGNNRVANRSSKVLEDIEKIGESSISMTNQLSTVLDEMHAVNENTHSLDNSLSRSNKEYIDALKCEMELTRNNIIKGVTRAIFPAKSEDCNSVFVSSRKEGVRYLGGEGATRHHGKGGARYLGKEKS